MINELFFGEPKLQKKFLALLTKDASGSEEEYYSDSNEDSEYEFSPILSLNVVTNKSHKEFLLDLIGQILDIDIKREYLEKLKGIILEEEDKSFKFNLETPSISQIFDRYPIQNPYKQITTEDLQAEVNELRGQVRIHKYEVLDPVSYTHLTLPTKRIV